MMEEKDCPKCKRKQSMSCKGLWTNKVILNINEDGHPQYFQEEIEEYQTLSSYPEEKFWECEDCSYKEEIK